VVLLTGPWSVPDCCWESLTGNNLQFLTFAFDLVILVEEERKILFQTLSEELGAKVKKNNLKSSLERWRRVSNVSHVNVSDSVHIGHINNVNVCGDSLPSSAVPQPLTKTTLNRMYV